MYVCGWVGGCACVCIHVCVGVHVCMHMHACVCVCVNQLKQEVLVKVQSKCHPVCHKPPIILHIPIQPCKQESINQKTSPSFSKPIHQTFHCSSDSAVLSPANPSNCSLYPLSIVAQIQQYFHQQTPQTALFVTVTIWQLFKKSQHQFQWYK